MTAKEYLQQIYQINCEIARQEQFREQLRSTMYGLRSPAAQTDNKVQTSVSSDDTLLALIAKVERMEHDINEKKIRLVEKLEVIISQIEGIDDERYRRILTDRYVRMIKWERIAVNMDRDIRYVYRLHGNALQKFAEKYGFDH